MQEFCYQGYLMGYWSPSAGDGGKVSGVAICIYASDTPQIPCPPAAIAAFWAVILA
ncbi:hypothetical protein D1872_333620 [compost metagenome]